MQKIHSKDIEAFISAIVIHKKIAKTKTTFLFLEISGTCWNNDYFYQNYNK